MTDIITFEDALTRTKDKTRHLLLANGFSIKYFSYKNLLAAANLAPDDALLGLFAALDTVDFERAIHALESAAVVEGAYKDAERAKIFGAEADRVREALVKAVKDTHPAFREDIEDVIPNCVKFLKSFYNIYTTNYDLLLYWASLKVVEDGFGLSREQSGFLRFFDKAAYCHLFNLHGGLHLFLSSTGDVEKRVNEAGGVIDAIARTITQDKRLPIYVAEGTSAAKLARIKSVAYLRHCYEQLGTSDGVFFVYGHSADPNDAHIYNALFTSQIEHLYFCIHKPTTKVEAIDGELARYKKINKSSINYTFVDAESVHVWDRPKTTPASVSVFKKMGFR